MDLAIKTNCLSKNFGSVQAVDCLNLQVPAGSVFGFLGPNGAGKTTTIKMLLGLTRPSAGAIELLGQPATSGQYLARVGYLPDVPNFYNWMRGEEFLTFVGQLYSIPPRELKKRVAEMLELTGLRGVTTKIGGYSRGMKQRLGLAQALINEPELVFLDEPTSALDPIGRKEVLETIGIISQRCTVFFSTHILADVERVCDRVGILRQGRLILDESLAELHKRFGQQVLRLEVTGPARDLAAALQRLPWVSSVQQYNVALLVAAADIDSACVEIPRLLAARNLGLPRLEPKALSLEDIFVRLVNDDEK